jgi:hypothetical protein
VVSVDLCGRRWRVLGAFDVLLVRVSVVACFTGVVGLSLVVLVFVLFS